MNRNQKVVLITTAVVVAAVPAIALARAVKGQAETPLEKIKRFTSDTVKKTDK